MRSFEFFLPVFYAIFIWWFTTGLIVVVYGRSRPVQKIAFGLATILLAAALTGILVTRHESSTFAVYAGVSCGVVIWGWHVASYYLGFVTGRRPADDPPPASLSLGRSFQQAFKAGIYHELLILLTAVLLAAMSWSAANRWALWTFLTLWLMHTSGKLNVFLGVRNFHIELLPHHLRYLDPLLGKSKGNALLPLVVIFAASFGLMLYYLGISPGTEAAETTGFLFVGTMILLGVFEHCLLVLPLPATLWGWGVRELPQPAESENKPSQSKPAAIRILSD